MISLRDALNVMRAVDADEEPVPFSLKVVEYNEQLGTGGGFFEVERAILTQSGKKSQKKGRFNEILLEKEKILKNPNHFDNLTLNITLLPSRNIRKIHVHLITRINGERLY